MLLLELAVVCRSLCEHVFQFSDAALCIFSLPLGIFGLSLSVFSLPPQLVLAAEHVVKQLLELLRIVREIWYDAHTMNERQILM